MAVTVPPRVAVIGAGTMGSQIAAQCALHEVFVVLIDEDPAHLNAATAGNRRQLERRVEKGALSQEDVDLALDRIRTATDIEQAADSGFAIEAVFEDLDTKRTVFTELVEACGPETILATNSSTFPISRIAGDLPFPERMCNMHFLHPVLVMRLVEIMRGPDTADDTIEAAVNLARFIDRRPIVIEREVPGLIVNRILAEIKREALWLAAEGYAEPGDIDAAVKLGLNHPMGPFELLDFSGLDVFYRIMAERYEETRDERWKPPELLEEMVKEGDLGRKTGRGFYEYES
jgi:3-hydroxybutyryl-CoA dehydrogenase